MSAPAPGQGVPDGPAPRPFDLSALAVALGLSGLAGAWGSAVPLLGAPGWCADLLALAALAAVLVVFGALAQRVALLAASVLGRTGLGDAVAQLGQDAVVEDAIEILLLTVHLGSDLVERLLGLLGVIGAVILFHDSAALIGHAYLIELLQVGGVDGEEADPLIDG